MSNYKPSVLDLNLCGPVSFALREALAHSDFSRSVQSSFVDLGKCLDRIATAEADPRVRVFVGIAMQHPDVLMFGYELSALDQLVEDHVKRRTTLPVINEADQLADSCSAIVGKILHDTPGALLKIRRLAGTYDSAVLARVTGAVDATLIVQLPSWSRPFGMPAGRA